ncbi:hypothetical protein SeMB42_g02396 [Synchytrium endobioticum]|nr:hypothetical protein SeLEV6574_g02222 [Synchytrium endobioticum]TPX50018.1 hypothetical protein SeMB42_g02396 [Synchytrium endobioticum]
MASETILALRVIALLIAVFLTAVTACVAAWAQSSVFRSLIVAVFVLNAAASTIQLVVGIRNLSLCGWWLLIGDLLEMIAATIWVFINVTRFGVFNRAHLVKFPTWAQRTVIAATALTVTACGVAAIVAMAIPSASPFANPALYYQLISLAFCLIVDISIFTVSLYLIVKLRKSLEDTLDFEDQTALRCAVIFSLVASLLIGTAGIAGVAATNDPPQEPGLIGAVGSIVLRIYYLAGLGFLYGIVKIIQPHRGSVPMPAPMQKPAGTSNDKFGEDQNETHTEELVRS